MYYNFDEVIDRNNTSCYKYDLRGKVFGKEDVMPMWVADMDFRTPPFVMDAIRKRASHEILGYTYMARSVNEAIVDWNKKRHHWETKPEWISFAPGVVPAVNLIVLAFSEPGDKIIVQPPVYFPFFTAVENHARQLVFNPLKYENGRYSMDLEALEVQLKDARMFILCNPHNPTGNTWPEAVLRQLGEMCLKYGVLLISDEIHGDLVYKGNRHIPMAGLSADVATNTITCMAPSKTFNMAGLSTSFLVIPDEKKRRMYEKKLDQIHVGAGNIFGYAAMESAYREGMDWLNQLMDYLEGNLFLLRNFLEKELPQIKVIIPQATYMVWLDCSELNLSPADLRNFMINRAGLGLSDGPIFGIGGEGFQRINIGCPRSILHEALIKLRDACVNYL
jgi:cysteine-S-conjugate beta-lyase